MVHSIAACRIPKGYETGRSTGFSGFMNLQEFITGRTGLVLRVVESQWDETREESGGFFILF